MTHYRTKNRKMCQKIGIFEIRKNSFPQIREKIIDYCYKNRIRCCKNCFQKVVYRIAEAKGELNRK